MTFRLTAILALTALAAVAHHPVTRYYDVTKAASISGTVTEVRWENPHAYVVLETGPANAKQRWVFEMNPPRTLERRGVNRQTIALGAQVSISGWPARDATVRAFTAREITFADGSTVTVGPTLGTGIEWECNGECTYVYPGQAK